MEKAEDLSRYSEFNFSFLLCVGTTQPLCFAVLGATIKQFWITSSFLHVVPLTHPVPFFPSLETGGRPKRKAMDLAGARELCWLYRPGHATGWRYGSVNEGKYVPERLQYTMSYKEPAACPACGTWKPQPRESLKSSFKKNGRDVALKCRTVVSYLRKCVKDSAQLPQGLSPVIKYIWFRTTCKKTTFKFLALFSGFCSSPAPRSSTERLKRKAVC